MNMREHVVYIEGPTNLSSLNEFLNDGWHLTAMYVVGPGESSNIKGYAHIIKENN